MTKCVGIALYRRGGEGRSGRKAPAQALSGIRPFDESSRYSDSLRALLLRSAVEVGE